MIATLTQEQRIELSALLIQQLTQFDRLIKAQSSQIKTTLHGLALQHGVGRFGRCLPRGWRKLADKLCYAHATTLMQGDPNRFIYCEGYAIRHSVGIVLGTHAWVLDRERDWQVIDNTWRNPVEGVYLGIPFTPEFVQTTVMRKGTYGLIDNWEEDFPILTTDPAEYLHPLAATILRDFVA